MKKNYWLLGVLLLSMAVNLGVLGTLVAKWIFPRGNGARQESTVPGDSSLLVGGEWRKTRQQMLATREKSKPLIDRSRKARKDFVAALSNEEFDESKARKALREFLAAREAMEESLGEGLITVRSGMKDSLAVAFFRQRMEQRGLLQERIADRLEERSAKRDSLRGDSLYLPRENIRDRIRERIKNRLKNR